MPKRSYTCLRCSHTWESGTPWSPERCPTCRSAYWDTPAVELSPEKRARVTGICMEEGCEEPVQGRRGLAVRCTPHQVAHTKACKAESRRRCEGRINPAPVVAPAPKVIPYAPASPVALTGEDLAREREASLARQRAEFEAVLDRIRSRGERVPVDFAVSPAGAGVALRFHGNRKQRARRAERSAA